MNGQDLHKLINSCLCVLSLLLFIRTGVLEWAAVVVFLCFVALKWTKQELTSEIAAFDHKTSTNNKNPEFGKCGM